MSVSNSLSVSFPIPVGCIIPYAGAVPFVTNATTVGVSTTTSVTLTSANPNIFVGQTVLGTGVSAGTTVSAIAGTALTLSLAPTSIPDATVLFIGNALPVPRGYLVCDGLQVAIADYPELYACIGNTYDNVADPDYFNLPDLVGRYIQGSATNTGTPIPTVITNASLNVTLTEPDLPPIPFSVTSATFSGIFPQQLISNNSYRDVFSGSNESGISATTGTSNAMNSAVTSQTYAFNQTPVPINDPVVASDLDPANITMTYLIRYTSTF
jgi:microcystin-dependent protein